MALHWQHIKGVYGSEPLYTYLEFSDDPKYNPHIYMGTNSVSDISDLQNKTDLGTIITSKAMYKQIMEQEMSFRRPVDFYTLGTINTDSSTAQLQFVCNNLAFMAGPTPVCTFIYQNNKFTQPSANMDRAAFKEVKIDDYLEVGAHIKLTANSGEVKAAYFNVPSDRRAKENIIPFAGHALNIINNLQTYVYNYKHNSEKSYGVMAQDLLDIDINGFSFVQNAEAKGDGDYMSIHESKLVYLLIEGMKEQQQQIAQLQAELAALKNK